MFSYAQNVNISGGSFNVGQDNLAIYKEERRLEGTIVKRLVYKYLILIYVI